MSNTTPAPTEAETWLRSRYGAYRGHFAWRELEEAFNAGRAQPAASPAPVVAREPVAADDIKEPKNGRDWRVEWWNESCRMMLPACMKLDSFQSYKNGTLMFTLKRRTDGGITSKEGDTKC